MSQKSADSPAIKAQTIQGEGAEKRPVAKKAGRNSEYSPQFWVRTRGLWEATPKLSPAKAAAQACQELGIASPPHHSTIAERKAKEGWEKGAAPRAGSTADKGNTTGQPAPEEAETPQPAPAPAGEPADPQDHPQPAATAGPDPFKDLTAKQALFVDEYLLDLNGTQAYMRAFKTTKTNSAAVEASRLLANPKVQAAVAHGKAERRKRLQIDQDYVLKGYQARYEADPRELVELLRVCCPFCHGPDFKRQYTPSGLQTAREEHVRRWAASVAKGGQMPEFDQEGGLGFDQRKPPHPDCPECHGFGEDKVLIKDTRTLSLGAQALYEGVEVTKDGLRVKIASRSDALTNIARHTGFYEKDNEMKVSAPTIEQLEKQFAGTIHKARERQARVEAERGVAPDG